jgi:AcrR family transcriptional regulator
MAADPGPRRPGRRAGPTTTRDAIAAAARELFSTDGYDRTSIRAIARAAGVDPALVLHFYGSKPQLFREVVELPVDLGAVVGAVLDGDRATVGRRLAQVVAGTLEDPAARGRLLALARAVTSQPEVAALVRDVIHDRVYGPLAAAVGTEDARLRAAMVSTQVVGLLMTRHVVGVEPLASLSAEDLAELLAPVLQHWLTGPLR